MTSDKELLKQKNMITFIESAQRLIESEGIRNVSIRKIAEKAGFHNSTIYLYFKDVDELILLASLKYFAEYSQSLVTQDLQKKSSSENFFSIWKFFADSVFEKPDIFYNFFFGKYSDDLTKYFELYYSLFPEEREVYSDMIEEMYYGKNIYERSFHLLKPLLKESPRLNEENITIVNELSVGYLKELLKKKCENPSLSVTLLSAQLLIALHYLVS